ncbi:hypothetical protein QTO34_013467 [Cnephaeus nilssonii]|uniref:Ferritin n=1 Tax=Cnephaeus nilssonii TaxID=3371016 RepID=A0AA40I8X6_CNENI|nr:hypothetical protein QTO34_013467 [Eptesicus nilssonii]
MCKSPWRVTMVSCFNSAWTEPSTIPASHPEPAFCHLLTASSHHRKAPPLRRAAQQLLLRCCHEDCLHLAGAPELPQDSEAINRQINLELNASYVYLSVSYYFDRDDVALKNFAKYFLHQSHEERGQAEKLMNLQNQQGCDGENGQNAVECGLHLEKSMNQSLLDLHKLATDKNDPHLAFAGLAQ